MSPQLPKLRVPSSVKGQLTQGRAWSLSRDPRPPEPSRVQTKWQQKPVPEDPHATHSPYDGRLWAREHSRTPWPGSKKPHVWRMGSIPHGSGFPFP